MSRKRTNPPKRSFLARLRQLAIDVFLPPDIYYDKQMPDRVKWMHYASGALFFMALIALVFEADAIENTLRGVQFFWIAGFAGIMIASVVAFGIRMVFPALFPQPSARSPFYPAFILKSVVRNPLLLSLFLGLFLLTPAVASFINRQFAREEEICRDNPVIKKMDARRSRALWLWLKTEEDREERFTVTLEVFNVAQEGQPVMLCTRKGALGYTFVTEFRPASN